MEDTGRPVHIDRMSTRIYNGTRCSGELRPDIMARRLTDIVTPIHEQLVVEAVAVLVRAAIRGALTGRTLDAVTTFEFLSLADKAIDTASKSGLRSSAEFSLELSVAFVSDPFDDRYIYASAFAPNRRLIDAWERLPGVEAFPYWDNTDGPEDVSAADWEQRGRTWNRVLGYQPWSKVGVTWEAEIPSAAVLYSQGVEGFLSRVAAHVARLEVRRRRELVRRRDPESMARTARAVAYALKRAYTPADLAAEWDQEEAAERARFR